MKAIFLVIILSVVSSESSANCIRQSYFSHDYCGKEASKLAKYIPDGKFKGACAEHDSCYAAGAQKIVKAMENKYRMSMISASKEQVRDMKAQISDIQKSCDKKFLASLKNACNSTTGSNVKGCEQQASSYYYGVRAFGNSAMNNAINNGFVCR